MNKKYMTFGLMSLFALAIVSAGLVGYLSNKAEVSVTVESPFLFEVSSTGVGGSWVGNGEEATLSLDSIYGGESIHFFARDTNLANVPTVGDSAKIVTCDTGVTCADFVSVEAQTTTKINGVIQTTSQVWDIISLCTQVNNNKVEFTYGAPGNAMLVGQSDTTEITATFQPNSLGDYRFTLQKMSA